VCEMGSRMALLRVDDCIQISFAVVERYRGSTYNVETSLDL
jgi:hypothetical protein